MQWIIVYTRRFEKDLRNVPNWVKERLIEIIEQLKVNPYIGKRLRGPLFRLWSLRIGDYRLIYEIDDDRRVVILHRIGHRGRIYEQLSVVMLLIFFLKLFK